jgi:NADH-quinone oxidoreductase subunit M
MIAGTLLVAVIAVPALAAGVVAMLPGAAERAARVVAVLATIVAGGGVVALGAWRSSAAGPWAELNLPWIPHLDVRFHLVVDGVSWPLALLTAGLVLLCLIAATRHPGKSAMVPGESPEVSAGDATGQNSGPAQSGARPITVSDPVGSRALLAVILVLEAAVLGVFLAGDAILFFLFFEATLAPMWAMIAVWGGPRRAAAARKFLLVTLLGSLLMLVGIVIVTVASGTSDLGLLASRRGDGVSAATQLAACLFLLLGLGVKTPVWPLHTWLPEAHTEAPTVGSVLLAGVLLKVGSYGIIRLVLPVVPEGIQTCAPYLAGFAVAGILVAGLVCLSLTEIKRIIAYSSVGHMGFVLLGIATLTTPGVQAALIGNIAHGLLTGLLFFLIGAVKDRYGTGDLRRLGGLADHLPRLGAVLTFAAVGSLGLPGLAGFWGEAFALVGAWSPGTGLPVSLYRGLAVIAAIGAVLTTAYFLRLLRHVVAEPRSEELPRLVPVAVGEWVTWSPLIALSLVIGVAPSLVGAVVAPEVATMVSGWTR